MQRPILLWRLATILVFAASLVGALFSSAAQTNSSDKAPQAQAARQGDVIPQGDVPASGAQGLWAHSDEADLVADVVLIKGISHVPPPLRIIITDYVFEVRETIKGTAEKHLTVRNSGGQLRDGLGMDTLHSYKLREKERYLIFAREAKDGLYLGHVLQMDKDGALVADVAGRLIVGLRQGVPLTRPEAVFTSLRYLEGAPRPLSKPQGPPDKGTYPVAKTEGPPSLAKADPLSGEQIKKALHARLKQQKVEDLAPKATGGKFKIPESPPFVLAGGYVSEPHNFYTLLPDNNNWNWFQACGDNWNQMVSPSSSGRNWLVGFYNDASGNPIRNETPKANNGRSNLAVMSSAQMTAGGYNTWEALGANGVCYRWWETTNGRIKEVDVLVNSAIAGNEAQYRKSLTHELGHALILDHENRFFALLYPGTWQQPPNYASLWYARTDDILGVRTRLAWVNANIEANRWNLRSFTDMATWSQAHATPGTNGSLVMTSLSATSVNRGDRITFRNVHVENRGDQAAANVTLKFYLSWNPVVSNIDTEIASYTWNSFGGFTYWSGPLDATVPTSLAPGTYYPGWIATTSTADLTNGNNTALLLQGSSANFAPQTVVVH